MSAGESPRPGQAGGVDELPAAAPPAKRPDAAEAMVRTVEIAPPSARAETWNVLRAAALIVLATGIYIADTTATGGDGGAPVGPGGAVPAAAAGQAAGAVAAGQAPAAPAAGGAVAARDLMPYQRLFRNLGGEDQRLFRELQEGLIEAENSRSATHRWPAPAALAAQGIPPFADVPGRGGRRRYRWELRQDGLVVNYLGLPEDRRDPAFLLLVQEPDPRAPVPGAATQATDEIHHRLADGTLLHVSTWVREAPPEAAAKAAAPPGAPPSVTGDRAAAADPGVLSEPYARGWLQLLVGAAER